MKYFSLLLALFLTSGVFGQFSGKAYYQSKTTVDMDGFGGREMSEEMKKMIAERMKNYLEKTYILTFNGDESIYKEEEKLEAGAGSGGFGMMMGSFTPGEQYKDLSKQQIIQEQEFFGKQFLIIDSIPSLDWQIEEDEFKQIGQYLAIKATAIKEIDENDFSMARRRGRDRDEKPETEGDSTDVAEDSSKEEDPMEQIEIPKEVIVTAWYTPQIPVQNGPSEYGGLPGLILEMNVYRTTILCSKLVMNPKDAEKIEAPSKGQEVTREEYNKIVKEKVEEMRENFRGRGNGRGRRGF
ncbi:MAG: GLPGLI family protein [Flavobacteriaceae bacterium]|nr:GLPGLI family protein [Flavobacteriaceae bacterium]